MQIEMSANVHVEMAVRDVQQAYTFLHDAFGAERIEQEIVARISYPDFIEIEHVGLGEVVLQFCRPSPREKWPAGFGASVLSADIPHAGYLASFGPCVSNLNFCVTDILQAKSLLESEGILPAMEIPMSTPGKERPPGYYFTAMDKLGFDLEFTQGPKVPRGGQAPMYPAFTYPRPHFAERVRRLLRLRVVVDELDETVALLCRLFGAQTVRSRSEDRATTRTVDVMLGNLPVQYCQPSTPDGVLSRFREQRSRGVYSLVFGVDRFDETIPAIGGRSRNIAPGAWVGTPAVGSVFSARTYLLSSRSILGFDIEIQELMSAA